MATRSAGDFSAGDFSAEDFSAEELSKRIAATYLWLRVGMGVIALLLPILLPVVGKFLGDLPLQDSISAYYHASTPGGPPFQGVMRDYLVGSLCAIGVMLVLYHGFFSAEDNALNLAGPCLVGVAFFPMSWPEGVDNPIYKGSIPGVPLHGFCAGVFFLCIAYVCLTQSDNTLPLLKSKLKKESPGKSDEEIEKNLKYYSNFYKACGGGMIICIGLAILGSILNWKGTYIFWAEAIGVWSFSAYWLVKTVEIQRSNADQKAAQGEVEVVSTGTERQGEITSSRPKPTTTLQANAANGQEDPAPSDTKGMGRLDRFLGKVEIREKNR